MPIPQRADGARSRAAIVERGLALAADGGLPSASIGALASALGMSKSGVFAHFRSKRGLDAALLDAASERFSESVVTPAGAAPPGVARLIAMAEGWLSQCGVGPLSLLTAQGSRSDEPVRQHARDWQAAWRSTLATQFTEAVRLNELGTGTDPAQAAFEFDALLTAAHRGTEAGDPAAIGRGRLAIETTLRRLVD